MNEHIERERKRERGETKRQGERQNVDVMPIDRMDDVGLGRGGQ